MNRKLLLSVLLALAAAAAIGAAIAVMWPPRDIAAASDADAEKGAPESEPTPRTPAVLRVIREEPGAARLPAAPADPAAAARSTPVLKRLPELAPWMELAERDLAAALEKIKAAHAETGWQEMQATLAAFLLEKDFTKAPEVCELVDPAVMELALAHSLPAAYRRDRAGTATLVFNQLTDRALDFAAWQIVRCQLQEGNLAAAMQTHLRVPHSSQSLRSASDIAVKIGSGDLGAGLLWFGQLATEAERRAAHGRMAENLRKAGDADGLLRLLALIPSDEQAKRDGTFRWDRTSYITEIARIGRQTRNDSAVEELREHVTGQGLDFLELGLLQGERNGNVEERLARARALTNYQARAGAFSAVIGAEISRDPDRAMEFVSGLDDSTFANGVFQLFARQGSKNGPSFAAWVRGLPSGVRREQAIAKFVEINRDRPADFRELAREIAALAADPAQREKLARSIPAPEPANSAEGGGK